MKTVIIGGVAAGASCAARLRRLDEQAEIVMLERGPYISYANCGLPYHIGDVIRSRDALLVTTKEEMAQRFRIDVRPENEALSASGTTLPAKNTTKAMTTWSSPPDRRL